MPITLLPSPRTVLVQGHNYSVNERVYTQHKSVLVAVGVKAQKTKRDKQNENSEALSPQANYTDRADATSRGS
jgi:hypothetical protein